jgi:hypothetical protein
MLPRVLHVNLGASKLVPERLKVLLVGHSQLTAAKNHQVLIILLYGRARPVEGPGDDDVIVDHHELVVHMSVGVGIALNINPISLQGVHVRPNLLHTLIVGNHTNLNTTLVSMSKSIA